jgi:hypothetical protein
MTSPAVSKSAKSRNMGSLAVIVSLSLSLLAQNVSRKLPLFVSPGAAVCGLLQLAYVYVSDVMINAELVR